MPSSSLLFLSLCRSESVFREPGVTAVKTYPLLAFMGVVIDTGHWSRAGGEKRPLGTPVC